MQNARAESRSLHVPRSIRYAAVLALVLALATGGVAGLFVGKLGAPVPTDRSVATTSVVYAFYDAANAVLASGDPAALDNIVAPGVVIRGGPPGLTPDRAGLERYLLLLRATAPRARFEVIELVAGGSRAMARVELHDASARAFLGGTLAESPPAWSLVDRFSITAGRVSELAGDNERGALFEPLGKIEVETAFPAGAGLALVRATLRPGDQLTSRPDQARIVLVLAGALTLTVDPTSPAPVRIDRGATGPAVVAAGESTVLAGNDRAALVETARYVLQPEGADAATLLAAVIDAAAASAPAGGADPSRPVAGTPWPAGLAVWPLVTGLAADPLDAPSTVWFGQVTLAPGAELSGLAGTGPIVLAVETGVVTLTADAGSVWFSDGRAGTIQRAAAGELGIGSGAKLPPAAPATFTNTGSAPAEIIFVAFIP